MKCFMIFNKWLLLKYRKHESYNSRRPEKVKATERESHGCHRENKSTNILGETGCDAGSMFDTGHGCPCSYKTNNITDIKVKVNVDLYSASSWTHL